MKAKKPTTSKPKRTKSHSVKWPNKGKNNELEIPGGMLVYAVIGDYQGKGRKRVILHEVTVDWQNESFAYGHRKTWNFPTR